MSTKISMPSLESIDNTQLDAVNGGGLIGSALKLGAKALPYVKKAGPKVADAAKKAAIWTGIPTAIGSGVAAVEHHFKHE